MDPDTAYNEMIQAWVAGDYETAYTYATDLNVWLSRGGFPPSDTGYRHVIETVLASY